MENLLGEIKNKKVIENRYEFVVLFDVENGNPNGDPDAGNAPRVDPETGLGIVSDVCLKRKVRNYAEIVAGDMEGFDILIENSNALNDKFLDAHERLKHKKEERKTASAVEEARKFMCENYYDVRTFGAVMSTGDSPCGIVRGPVQVNFARSIDPILPQELTITRQAITKPEDFKKRMDDVGMATELGKKNIVPYALYRAEGYISARLAQKETGFSEGDLALLWDALLNMFEHDHSAARGKMCVRGLYVFKHDSVLGNAPSATLFDKIKIEKKAGVIYPRSISDYTISVDENMPNGVKLDRKLG